MIQPNDGSRFRESDVANIAVSIDVKIIGSTEPESIARNQQGGGHLEFERRVSVNVVFSLRGDHFPILGIEATERSIDREPADLTSVRRLHILHGQIPFVADADRIRKESITNLTEKLLRMRVHKKELCKIKDEFIEMLLDRNL